MIFDNERKLSMQTPQIIEFNNQRLLTTDQLAAFYETSPTRIKQNFGYNKEKFIEGKHYYFLQGDELREFKDRVGNSDLVGKNARSLLLYTKQGASRHSKMLGTDRAWDMFDELEETYFNVQQQMQLPSSPRELLQLVIAGNEETNLRIDDVDKRVKQIEENKLITNEDVGTIARSVSKKVNQICREQHLDQQAKTLLFMDINGSVKRAFDAPNRGRIKDKDFIDVLKFIDDWQPSAVTKHEIKKLQSELKGCNQYA